MSDQYNSDTVPENNSLLKNTRRRFLGGAIGAVAVGAALPLSVSGDDHAENADAFEDDIDILNYALTLEYLQANFYDEALSNIGRDEILELEPLDDINVSHKRIDEAVDRIIDEFETIKEHEEAHVAFLEETIESFDEEPIDEPAFSFGEAVEDPKAFVEAASTIEDTAVGAYAGAAPFIEDEDVLPPALGVHSVEARHASFVRVLGLESGFPDAVDEPLPREDVEEIASEFISE